MTLLRRELLALGGRRVHVLGNRPDRLHRRRDRERIAVAIEHAPARRRDFEQARIARVAFSLQEIGLERLQHDCAGDEHGERGKEREQHEAAWLASVA